MNLLNNYFVQYAPKRWTWVCEIIFVTRKTFIYKSYWRKIKFPLQNSVALSVNLSLGRIFGAFEDKRCLMLTWQLLHALKTPILQSMLLFMYTVMPTAMSQDNKFPFWIYISIKYRHCISSALCDSVSFVYFCWETNNYSAWSWQLQKVASLHLKYIPSPRAEVQLGFCLQRMNKQWSQDTYKYYNLMIIEKITLQ